MDSLEKFNRLGFNYFKPTRTDHTCYFVKHIEKGNHIAQLWIVLRKKTPTVTYKYDYKTVDLPRVLEGAVAEFLDELGYELYRTE